MIHTAESDIILEEAADRSRPLGDPLVAGLRAAPRFQAPLPSLTDTRRPIRPLVPAVPASVEVVERPRRRPATVHWVRAVLAAVGTAGLAVAFVPALASSAAREATNSPSVMRSAPGAAAAATGRGPAVMMGWSCPESPVPGLEGFGRWDCARPSPAATK